ncbi:hypothetical protein [Methylosinus sp. Ce-a6]|uniref:hypothetical protein n=1 Tax=Methylosinus sp. Ce-a6 TaxID=2172005 RepID=UPI00135BEE35|nr:hypothetical protein [Methylosinus sp. Ce-a6]
MIACCSELRKKLTEVFERLPGCTASPHDISLAVDRLILFSVYPGSPSRAFRVALTKTTKKELSELATRAASLAGALLDPKLQKNKARQKLAEIIETLHGTSIEALANVPPWNPDFVVDMGVMRKLLPTWLRDETSDRASLAADLRLVAELARRACPRETQDEGRQADHRAHAVARRLALDFFEMTGKRPTIIVPPARPAPHLVPYAGAPQHTRPAVAGYPQGDYLELVTDVFGFIGVKTDALRCAREAQKKFDPYRHSGKGD